MTPAEFVASFETVAESPGGIKKLRDMILGFAVRGRLVSQDPKDEPASALMRKVAEARAKLSGSVSGARDAVTSVAVTEEPYPLPLGWAWIRLGSLGGFLGGGTPSKSNAAFWNGELPWVSPKDMKRPYISDAEDHISEAAVHGSAVKLIPSGSLLFVVRGMILAHSFPTALTTREVTINQDMKALVLALPAVGEYLLRAGQAARVRMLTNVEHSSHGTCRLDSEQVQQFPVPLPPLAEQKRIVAKVDQLMALCDDLEARQAKKRETAVRLNRAALDALTTAEGPEEVAASFRRVTENFEVLVDAPDGVKKLRDVILNLAMRGRLVRSDPKDEAVSSLLVRLGQGYLSKEHRSSAALDQEPYKLNDGWSWCRFVDVASIESCLVDPSKFLNMPHVAPDNIEKGTGRLLAYNTIGQDGVFSSKHRFYPGQILYSKIRPNLSKVVVVDFEGLCSADMYPVAAKIDTRFLHLFMLSPEFLRQVVRDDNRLAMPKVNQQQLSETVIAVPPLAEQKRIVAKVDQLMALCDSLEVALRRAEGTAQKLAEAVVAEIVA